VLRVRQQTPHDVMLKLSTSDCDEMLAAVGQLRSTGTATVSADVLASLFNVRTPRVLTLRRVHADADSLRREGGRLTWGLEVDTCEEIVEKVMFARKTLLSQSSRR
jgi:hypothetical protein